MPVMGYRRSGSGSEPLVLIHGVGHSRAAWDLVVPLLDPHFDVIAVDLPGHGVSAPLDLAGRSLDETIATEFEALFDHLELDRPHVAGNSLGGRIALEIGARGMASTVSAISPAGFWAGWPEVAYVKALFAGACGAARALGQLGPLLLRSPIGLAALRIFIESPGELTAQQMREMMQTFDTARPALKTILAEASAFAAEIPAHVPVTIAWGTRDRVLPFRQSRIAQLAVPHASLIPLKGCGHVPMPDAPQLVAHLLLAAAAKGSLHRSDAAAA